VEVISQRRDAIFNEIRRKGQNLNPEQNSLSSMSSESPSFEPAHNKEEIRTRMDSLKPNIKVNCDLLVE
jgi:hypothetical protein